MKLMVPQTMVLMPLGSFEIVSGICPPAGAIKFISSMKFMLSTSAFNALLKTLEEPPNHVLFIMATTEVQKFQILFCLVVSVLILDVSH